MCLLYAGFSAGFKSGGFNGSYIDTPGQEEPFKEEILYAYEAGIKGDFMNNRLRANASVFYYDYQDMQYQFFPHYRHGLFWQRRCRSLRGGAGINADAR